MNILKKKNSKFLFIFFLLFLLTALVFYAIYRNELDKSLYSLKVSESSSIAHLEDYLTIELSHIFSDLSAFQNHHQLRAYIDDDSQMSPYGIINDFGVIQEKRNIYDQIRYIDKSGQERIRLNYINGKSFFVPSNELQNKSDRYYFREIIALNEGEIYISALDLNVENGAIELPYKSMLRIGTPVYSQNELKGVLIINVLADYLLNQIQKKLKLFSSGKSYVTNSSGYWLVHPEADKRWGFMLGHEERFDADYPDEWQKIKANHRGQFSSENGLFSYVTVSPLANQDKGPSWTIITLVEDDTLNGLQHKLMVHLIAVFSFMGLLYLVVAYKLSHAIQQREEANDLIKQREETIRLILNEAKQGIYGVDIDGRCTFFNKAAESILGFSFSDLANKKIHDFVSPPDVNGNDISSNSCVINKVLGSKVPCSTEDGYLLSKKGELINVSYHIHPIISTQEVKGAVVTFSDISEKKKAITHRIRSGQLAALGELAAGVAHEINNPITGVINYAQLVLNKYPEQGDERNKLMLRNIIKEGDRIAEIVQNLLRFAHKDQTVMERVSLGEVVSDAIQLLDQQLRREHIMVEVEIPETLPMVTGNSQKLVQVMINLMSNARHAIADRYSSSHPDKRISISAHELKNGKKFKVCLSVLDYGVGMSYDQRQKAFDRFYTTKAAGEGTGLGLSIVHDILEDHGAIIHLESEVNHSTEIRIYFPDSEVSSIESNHPTLLAG